MGGSKIINEYFKQFEEKSKYKRINQVTGFEYSLIDSDVNGEILRFFIDNNLDACISKIKHRDRKKYLIEYIDKSDLLIIGFCLEDEIQINYREKKTIKKGEVLYFRPKVSFSIEFFNNSFLYYIIDLNNFKESLCHRNCKKFDSSFCNSYVDYICKKGEIHIKKAPYMMKSCIDEIKEIENIETNSFLDYTNIKGQLFNYLTCLLKLRLNENTPLNGNQCKVHKCKKHRVSEAKKIIIDNLDRHITVKEIAERLDTSIYKLQKSFKKMEGTTVYDFILKVKIDNGKTLLKKTNEPIIEIAQKLGYENSSKFSTAFKKITGNTPTEYRLNIRD